MPHLSSTCEFPSGKKGERCSKCGFTLPVDFSAPPAHRCIASICPHLLPPIERAGATILVKCGCSGQEKEQFHVAHGCEIHGRCLPTLRLTDEQRVQWEERKPESDLYHLCHGCADRPSLTPTAPHPTPASPISREPA